jgi:hypothetical protein
MTIDLHRGYLSDGKDRQHPVRDPDDTSPVITEGAAFIAMWMWHSTLPIYQPIGWPIADGP